MPLPVDLSKLSDVVKNDIVTKTVHNKLATKGNSVDTDAFVLKTNYDTDKKATSGLIKKKTPILKSLK